MIHKNNDAYKSIGEVAKILDLVNKDINKYILFLKMYILPSFICFVYSFQLYISDEGL